MYRFSTRARFARRGASVAVLAGLLATTLRAPAGAIIYTGTPNLALTTSMVVAGGGPGKFSSMQLFKVLTGSLSDAEATKLTKQFGAADVKNTFAVFDFTVNDVVRIATEKHIALPAPVPAPTDGKALAVALYGAGITTTGRWDVGYMLEHLISHPLHHAVMHDIDAKFGAYDNARFHIVLAQMMDDLAMAYRTASR
jgi:hypothetical protein